MRTLSLLMILACVPFCRLGAEETVIVNAKAAVSSLDIDALRDLFLGKKTSWDDGGRVIVAVLKDGPSHEDLMKLLGKNPQQFITSWKKLVFTGKGAMPEQLDGEEALVDYVAKTPGAIAYVDKSKLKDGVKAVPAK